MVDNEFENENEEVVAVGMFDNRNDEEVVL